MKPYFVGHCAEHHEWRVLNVIDGHVTVPQGYKVFEVQAPTAYEAIQEARRIHRNQLATVRRERRKARQE